MDRKNVNVAFKSNRKKRVSLKHDHDELEESGGDGTSTTPSNEEKNVEDDHQTDGNNSSDNQSVSEENNDEHEHSESTFEKYKDLLVTKEECINHVGKRVMNY